MDADGAGELTFRVLLRRFVAVVLVAVIGATLVDFPYAQIALTLGLCLYGAVLYVYPNAWLIVIPALLPVLDLAPWSGWFFLDELDLFVLMTLAIGLWRPGRNAASSSNAPRFLFLALGMLSISYAVSMLIGLLPLQPWDANAFSNYYSHYNSLRMGKGFFEAVALFLLFVSQASGEGQKLQGFVAGMVLGLIGVVVAVVWERLVFTGIFDFASVFRVTATFSGMHNGGNDLEAYVVLAQPFVVALIVLRKNPAVTLGGLALFILSTYASLITFSRSCDLGANRQLDGAGLVCRHQPLASIEASHGAKCSSGIISGCHHDGRGLADSQWTIFQRAPRNGEERLGISLTAVDKNHRDDERRLANYLVRDGFGKISGGSVFKKAAYDQAGNLSLRIRGE